MIKVDICIAKFEREVHYVLAIKVNNKTKEVRALSKKEYVKLNEILSKKYKGKPTSPPKTKFQCLSYEDISKEDLEDIKNYGFVVMKNGRIDPKNLVKAVVKNKVSICAVFPVFNNEAYYGHLLIIWEEKNPKEIRLLKEDEYHKLLKYLSENFKIMPDMLVNIPSICSTYFGLDDEDVEELRKYGKPLNPKKVVLNQEDCNHKK